MVKKGQLSLFILLSLILIILSSLIFVVTSKETENTTDPRLKVTQSADLFPVEKYVKQCIHKEIIPLTKKYASNGFYFNSSNDYVEFNGNKIMKHYTPKKGNSVITKNYVADKLSSLSDSLLEKCINTTRYENMGYKIKDGPVETNITIAKKSLKVDVNYNITLYKKAETIKKSKFTEFINLPLGEIMKISNEVLNSKIYGNFDTDTFRFKNPEHQLEISKPYPDIIFSISNKLNESLTKSLKINFAIGTPDVTLNKFAENKNKFKSNACYIEDKCYSGSTELECYKKKGSFNSNEKCQSLYPVLTQEKFDQIINGKNNTLLHGNDCNKWYDVWSGRVINETHKSGESWCSYEPGVGGRQYKLVCINGEVIVEPCRDFKEEICVDNTLKIDEETHNHAVCRINKFESCNDCESKSCCENSELRDCYWDKETGCTSSTPPGTKFWINNEADTICSMESSSRSYNTDTKISFDLLCANSGDCGIKQNYYGDYPGITTNNYNSQLKEKLEHLAQKKKDSRNNLLSEVKEKQNFNFEKNRRTREIPGFVSILNNYLKHIDNAMLYDIDEYLDPDIPIKINNNYLGRCDSWDSPILSDCSSCGPSEVKNGTNNYAICTEYKCKSLGKNCIFRKVNGYPLCQEKEENPEPLEILDIKIKNRSQSEIKTPLGEGNLIDEKIKPGEPIDMKIITNKESLCKLSYLPDKNFYEIPVPDMTNKKFTKIHGTSISFNHGYEVLDEIPLYFNSKNYSNIMEKLIDLRYKFETFKRKYPSIDKYSKGIYKLLVPITEYYFDLKTQKKLKYIFEGFDKGKYNIMLKCIDLGGKETKSRHISFELNYPCEDKKPPQILKTHPKNEGIMQKKFNVYLDEISECRYDTLDLSYKNMRYDLECEKNPYQISPVADGSYKCSGIIHNDTFISVDKAEIFIKCKDHPEFDQRDNKFIIRFDERFNYKKLNNNTYNGSYEIKIDNSSKIDIVNLEDLIKKEDYGEYLFYIPHDNSTHLKIGFPAPFECKSSKCSSSSCLTSLNPGNTSHIIECKRKIPECSFYERNSNKKSYKLILYKRKRLEIESTSYLDKQFYIDINDTINAQSDCGIRLDNEEGYLEMKETEDGIFNYKIKDSEIGYHEADIICINKYGDEKHETIGYEIY
ncbi:MAG: hypothetical protein ACQER9_03395 [Nanobdellota archaeon]